MFFSWVCFTVVHVLLEFQLHTCTHVIFDPLLLLLLLKKQMELNKKRNYDINRNKATKRVKPFNAPPKFE